MHISFLRNEKPLRTLRVLPTLRSSGTIWGLLPKFKLFITHHSLSLLIIHHSYSSLILITHYSLLIAHYSLPVTHHPLLITHHSSLITHHPSLITHRSSHLLKYIIYRRSAVLLLGVACFGHAEIEIQCSFFITVQMVQFTLRTIHFGVGSKAGCKLGSNRWYAIQERYITYR